MLKFVPVAAFVSSTLAAFAVPVTLPEPKAIVR